MNRRILFMALCLQLLLYSCTNERLVWFHGKNKEYGLKYSILCPASSKKNMTVCIGGAGISYQYEFHNAKLGFGQRAPTSKDNCDSLVVFYNSVIQLPHESFPHSISLSGQSETNDTYFCTKVTMYYGPWGYKAIEVGYIDCASEDTMLLNKCVESFSCKKSGSNQWVN